MTIGRIPARRLARRSSATSVAAEEHEQREEGGAPPAVVVIPASTPLPTDGSDPKEVSSWMLAAAMTRRSTRTK